MAKMTVDLPCKLGDEVWAIKRCFDVYNRPYKTVVKEMYFADDMRLCIVAKGICRGEWGKAVFATQEEAIAEIERRKNHEKV